MRPCARPGDRLSPRLCSPSRGGCYIESLCRREEVRVARKVVPKFESQHSYRRFARAVHRKARYIRDDETQRFLDALLKSAKERVEVVKAGKVAWRAQLGHDWRRIDEIDDSVEDSFGRERMVPQADKAREGRANPKGIPYLYLATKRDTAIAEVRPWNGSYVSVSQFQIMKKLSLVNCTVEKKSGHWTGWSGKPPPPERVDKIVWSDIDAAFCRPVTDTEDTADYAPTQIIAELCRTHGYDGVAYRSAVGEGHNVVLFDIHAARLVNGQLYKVDGVSLRSSPANNLWVMADAMEPRAPRRRSKAPAKRK